MKKTIFAACAALTTFSATTAAANSPFVGQYVGVLGGISSLRAKTTIRYVGTPFSSITDIKNSYHGGAYAGYGLAWGTIITSAEFLAYYDNAKVKKVTNSFSSATKRGMVYEIAGRAGFMVSPTTLIYGRFGVSTNNTSSEVTISGEPYKSRKYRFHWAPGFGAEYVIQTRRAGNFIVRAEYAFHEDFKSEYKVGDVTGAQQGQVVHRLRGHYLRVGVAKQLRMRSYG